MNFNIVCVEDKLLTTILGNRRDYIGTKHLEGWINIWLTQNMQIRPYCQNYFLNQTSQGLICS